MCLKAFQMPKQRKQNTATLLWSWQQLFYLVHHDKWEVNSKNTMLMLQSDLLGLCALSLQCLTSDDALQQQLSLVFAR